MIYRPEVKVCLELAVGAFYLPDEIVVIPFGMPVKAGDVGAQEVYAVVCLHGGQVPYLPFYAGYPVGIFFVPLVDYVVKIESTDIKGVPIVSCENWCLFLPL